MNYGLTKSELEQIISVLEKNPEIEIALIFGSRAINNYQVGSDIDLALKGKINLDIVAKVKAQLEELPLPYFFDVIDYHSIANCDFKEHIDRHGQVIFSH